MSPARGLRRARSAFALQCAAHAAAVCLPALAWGGVAWDGGSATWTWDGDTGSANAGKTVFTIAAPSSGAMSSFQLSKSGSYLGGSATGRGSIGYVANPTTATFTFAGGTGATQADPSDDLPGETITKVTFSGLFDPTSPSFGPTATGYLSLTVGGTAGAGGYARVVGNFNYRLNSATGTALRSPISFDDTFLGGAGGSPFSKTYTYSQALSPSTIALGQKVFVSGSLTFFASNHGGPAEIEPTQFEAGGAPPTATMFGGGGFTRDWFDPAVWTAPNLPAAGIFAFTEPGALIPTIPNGVGQRARVPDTSLEPRGVLLSSDVTLGALHIEDRNTLLIQPDVTPHSLTMDVNAGGASIYVGSAAGNATHAVNVPVVLADPLEIRVESSDPFLPNAISFNDTISSQTPTAPQDVTIVGSGQVFYNAANTYNGTTTITDGGELVVSAAGALGTGSVVISNGGKLVINNSGATSGGQTIQIGPGGAVEVNSASLGSLQFAAAAGASIAGSPTTLALFDVGTNLTLAPGSIVGHDFLDFSPGGNPSNLGATPQYVFGVRQDIVGPLNGPVEFGSATPGSPWFGFGSSGGGERIVGDDPADPMAPFLNINGSGALLADGGVLRVRNRVTGGSQLFVRGNARGVVVLESQHNSYDGTITVQAGGNLRVDGNLPAARSVIVQSGGQLGGAGSIGTSADPLTGNVTVQSGGVLDPGLETVFDESTATLAVRSLTMLPGAELNFEFGGMSNSDAVLVSGDLVLDGDLLVRQLNDFDATSTYTLFTFGGTLTDNGLAISPLSQDVNGVPAAAALSIQVIPNFGGVGGSVVLVVPEPAGAAVALLAGLPLLRRRRH